MKGKNIRVLSFDKEILTRQYNLSLTGYYIATTELLTNK